MAQKQFNNYQDDILSFDLREAMLGILNPGRFCGFDTLAHVSTGSGVINVTVGHATSGIQKADKTYPTPVLSSVTGVAMTTQGMIIHEDTLIPIAIDDGSANGGSDRYDVIYIQHRYLDGTPGDNPAVYGIRKGTPGSGVPTVQYPTYQVPIIEVLIPNGSTTFAALGFTILQNELGDIGLISDLLTIVGNRVYTEQNYVTNAQSLTASVNALDMRAKDNADNITTLLAMKLDDWATPDDNTDLNASITRHGLLPKLSNVVTEFLNGLGNWATPAGQRWVWRQAMVSADFDKSDFGNFAASSGTLDLSSIVPADCEVVWVVMYLQPIYGATNKINLLVKEQITTGGYSLVQMPATISGDQDQRVFHFMMGLSATKTVYWQVNQGTPSTHVDILSFQLSAWQSAL